MSKTKKNTQVVALGSASLLPLDDEETEVAKELGDAFGEEGQKLSHFCTPWHVRTLWLWNKLANDASANSGKE